MKGFPTGKAKMNRKDIYEEDEVVYSMVRKTPTGPYRVGLRARLSDFANPDERRFLAERLRAARYDLTEHMKVLRDQETNAQKWEREYGENVIRRWRP